MQVANILATLALATAGFAPATATLGAQGDSQATRTAPAKKICESYTVTGSRLAKKRVCGTAEEWADRRLQDRQVIERVQLQPCVLQTTTASGRPGC